MCLVISNLSGERYGLWISTYIGREKLIEDLFKILKRIIGIFWEDFLYTTLAMFVGEENYVVSRNNVTYCLIKFRENLL